MAFEEEDVGSVVLYLSRVTSEPQKFLTTSTTVLQACVGRLKVKSDFHAKLNFVLKWKKNTSSYFFLIFATILFELNLGRSQSTLHLQSF